jgi:hypothetical protein
VNPNFRPPRPRGFVATGPSFYVWEERRSDAVRAARDLLPRPDAAPIAVSPASRPPRSRKG